MADYGRVLDFQGGGGGSETPPEDIYTFVVAEVSDPEEKDGFNEGERDIQIVLTCKIVDYPYDEDDEDDFDWNGTPIKHWVVLGRMYPKKDKDGEVQRDRSGDIILSDPSPVWKSDHPNAKHRKVIEAIFPEWDWTKEGLKNRAIDLNEFPGRKFRASITHNDKGYARLSNFTKAKSGKKAKSAPVQVQAALDDDDDLLNDDE